MIDEIEIEITNLIKRKLSNMIDWEKEYIPKEILDRAKKTLEENKIRGASHDGETWLDHLLPRDYQTIIMFHCVNCRKTQQNAKHNFRICKR